MGQSGDWLGVPIRERTHAEKVAYLDGYQAAINAVDRFGVNWARQSLDLARSTVDAEAEPTSRGQSGGSR